jgi:hypothetical protein
VVRPNQDLSDAIARRETQWPTRDAKNNYTGIDAVVFINPLWADDKSQSINDK